MTFLTNPDVLAKYIQYRLGMLGEENAHHRFEELCFRIARATVASHLLPPTGPVSAGGDQGRDFESYRIEGAGGNVTRIFAQSVTTTDTTVFACTTKKGSDADLVRKAKQDVVTACGREPKPTVVYFYAASETLAPAARHNLQDWARAEYGVTLEVIDQRSISELLADPANHWLANYYLAVPEEMLQNGSEGEVRPGWYDEARRRFGDPDTRYIVTYAELDLIVRCARHAWGTDGLEADDGLWLDLLADIWGTPNGLRTEPGLRAFYEAFVYLLRGRERCGLEAHIPSYVEGLILADDVVLAHDAHCFASYLVGGVQRGHVILDALVASALFQSIVDWLEAKIDFPPGPLVLSDLLVARGSLVFSTVSLGDEPLGEDEITRLATEVLDWWTRALDVGEKLISFPLLRLNKLLGSSVSILVASPGYDVFVERLDQACEQRHTSEGLAATMFDRAIGFFNSGQYLNALSPTLVAKRHWHNGDRIGGSLMASMLAEQCMERLGLLWAAKRLLFDVVAVINRLGDREHANLLTGAVFQLAELQYLSGEWANAVHTLRLGLDLHHEFAPDSWNFEKHTRLQRGTFVLVNILVAGDLVAPGFRSWGEKMVERLDLEDVFEQSAETVRGTWKALDIRGPDYPLHGPPLADLAPIRRARWQALGLMWEVNWHRDYELEALGTELAALLQFVQVGLAKGYKHLLPTSVTVEIVPWQENEVPVRQVFAEQGVGFCVMLPTSKSEDDPIQDLRSVALYAVTMIIEAVSVDSDLCDRLPGLVGNMIADGLFVGGDVLEGLNSILPFEEWQEVMAAPAPTGPDIQLEAVPTTKLAWRKGRSPLFDETKAEEKLRTRYEAGFRMAKPVLDAHSLEPALHQLVAELRADGWLDWQIVGAFALAAVSECVNIHYAGADQHTVNEAMQNGMQKIIAGSYDVPPWSGAFAQAIRSCLQVSMVSSLSSWGLDINYPKPDFDALRLFLDERFKHFTQDLPMDERPKFSWEQA